jgi:hypothetical protein
MNDQHGPGSRLAEMLASRSPRSGTSPIQVRNDNANKGLQASASVLSEGHRLGRERDILEEEKMKLLRWMFFAAALLLPPPCERCISDNSGTVSR